MRVRWLEAFPARGPWDICTLRGCERPAEFVACWTSNGYPRSALKCYAHALDFATKYGCRFPVDQPAEAVSNQPEVR